MIRRLPHDRAARARARRIARYDWRRRFVPLAVLNVDGIGRCVVVMRMLETRLSLSRHGRVWRVPA